MDLNKLLEFLLKNILNRILLKHFNLFIYLHFLIKLFN